MKCQTAQGTELFSVTKKIVLERSQEQMPEGFIYLCAFVEAEALCDAVEKT